MPSTMRALRGCILNWGFLCILNPLPGGFRECTKTEFRFQTSGSPEPKPKSQRARFSFFTTHGKKSSKRERDCQNLASASLPPMARMILFFVQLSRRSKLVDDQRYIEVSLLAVHHACRNAGQSRCWMISATFSGFISQ